MPKTQVRQNKIPLTVFKQSGVIAGAVRPLDKTDRVLKNVLIIYQGDHRDDLGRPVTVSDDDLYRFQAATKKYRQKGREVKVLQSHQFSSPSTHLGNMIADPVVRVITVDDVPNDRLQDVVGRLGLFGKVEIFKNKDNFTSGMASPASAGIDFDTGIVHEVSSVVFESIPGCSFFAQGITYDAVRQKRDAFSQERAGLDEAYDIFLEAYQRLQEQESSVINTGDEVVSAMQGKKQLLNDYFNHLKKLIGVQDEQGDPASAEESVYSESPFAPSPIRENPSTFTLSKRLQKWQRFSRENFLNHKE